MKDYLKNNKIQHTIFFLSIFFIILFSILKINSLLFITCSIAANMFLINIIKYIKDKLNIKLSTKEKILLVVTIIFIYSFYLYSVLTRKFIYYWDYSCYYSMQMHSITSFEKGLFEGIRFFIGSTWSGEYGNFLSFFPQVLFQFTNKSINSYILSFIIIFVPYVLYSFVLLLKTFEKYIKVKDKNKSTIFYFSIITMTLFPLLHGVLILGQPDFFGLTFLFLIICITLKYDFKKIELDRLIIIFLLTFMLIICRRWYVYWIVTYFLIYISNILLVNIKNKESILKIIRNIITYGIIVIILFLITLFPFIKNILVNDYASAYSYYYSYGGPITEILSQIRHLGLLEFAIIIGGLIYGLINKEYRRYTISVIIQYLLIIILFTKIQNLGLHHSLQLLTLYIYGIYMFLICIINNKKMKKLLLIMLSAIIVINFLFGCSNIKSKLFTDISLKVENDENYDSIKKIVEWLEKNLDENNTGYLITHNNKVNPDKLRNFKTPTSRVNKYVPYGSAIIGVHKFPIELFTAKYIMTTIPFENTSVEKKYNTVFKELIKEGKFKLIKEYKLKNKTTFEIYKRIEPVTEEEKNKYLDILKEENKEFKTLYADVINSYKVN